MDEERVFNVPDVVGDGIVACLAVFAFEVVCDAVYGNQVGSIVYQECEDVFKQSGFAYFMPLYDVFQQYGVFQRCDVVPSYFLFFRKGEQFGKASGAQVVEVACFAGLQAFYFNEFFVAEGVYFEFDVSAGEQCGQFAG